MNLKFEYNGLKLEIQNGDLVRVEKTIAALFAFVEGGPFVDVYNETEVEERPVNSKRNYTKAVEGVKEFEWGKTYQCTYSCGCGNNGIRFVKEDAVITYCHRCDQVLNLAPAAEDAAHDKDYNYFIAY